LLVRGWASFSLLEDRVSTHEVKIIEIKEVRPHDNADRLCIVPVGGWSCVVGKEQFVPGSKAIYIEPDYVVPLDRPEFAFLKKPDSDKTEHRLKAIRLRGVVSFGLLIPVPEGLAGRAVNDNVMEDLGIRRYEPPVKEAGADELPGDQWPKVYASKFDVESLNANDGILQDGELVIATEKIHGANARYLFSDGVFYMGSRTRWLKPDVGHIWKRAADGCPQIAEFCRANPDTVLYGEVFGSVQELKYGLDKGKVAFAAFAASSGGDWIDIPELHGALEPFGVPYAPIVYEGPFDRAKIAEEAEADSIVANIKGHMMEGVVIVPVTERRDDHIGRVALKLISNRYWLS
jgi:RNA ligase (TIGR02306 family)